jgi:hypothetical protein
MAPRMEKLPAQARLQIHEHFVLTSNGGNHSATPARHAESYRGKLSAPTDEDFRSLFLAQKHREENASSVAFLSYRRERIVPKTPSWFGLRLTRP